ncbi:MAG: ORF6N domain-containing protein [Dysgonamonadaceae bacterium]|nr:ORF6N domain-containing protein [Dysgonamonadaceae bacterium]
MDNLENKIMIPEDVIMTKIHHIRHQKVMIDRDLAELYGVETKRLKEAVKRNYKRFPEDFMFEMTKEEFEIWRSQFATSKSDTIGLRYAPFCFTEQGVTMLSCILKSDRAITVNIQIIRVFTRMREILQSHKEILRKLEEIQVKDIEQDKKIRLIFEYLKQFEEAKKKQLEHENRKPIGYKIPKQE